MNSPLYLRLLEYFERLGNAAIAFSGGADSSLACVAAHEALGDKAVALTVSTPYIARWEIEEARGLTAKRSMQHHIVSLEMPDAIRTNPKDRCYLCKGILFTRLKAFAGEHGFTNLCDGTNADDLLDNRPGLRALAELSVRSPLAELKIAKEQVRRISKELGLDTWDKPANACLLTRLPFDRAVSVSELRRIEEAEHFLIKRGLTAIRVRAHGDLARIETGPRLRAELLDEGLAAEIYKAFREFGFAYVALDLLGYRSGSFNEENQRTGRECIPMK
ncbi:MAG: ATP-dependent sacrificial sulfur transferase LarE [Desulfocapsaceae bacterium]|nr:ATP-dependent sacrificial sulfur transferase LarE [Desulfocapsaceae bacterium]